MSPKRVLLVLPHLGLGGAQRQALLMSENLSAVGCDVRIALTDTWSGRMTMLDTGQIPVQHLRFEARRGRGARLLLVAIGLLVGAGNLFRLVSGGRRTGLLSRIFKRLNVFALRINGVQLDSACLQEVLARFPGTVLSILGLRGLVISYEPSIVLSFLPRTNLISISAAKDLTKVVVMERNDFCRQPLEPYVGESVLAEYPSATIVGANSRHCVEDLKYALDAATEVVWVPNLVAGNDESGRVSAPTGRSVIASRFHPSKNVLRSIGAWEKTATARSGGVLHIYGSGEEERAVKRRAARSQLRVQYHGRSPDSYSMFSAGDLVILNSDYEGHPNVFDEALTRGALPLVSRNIVEVQIALGKACFAMVSFASDEELTNLIDRFSSAPKFRSVRDEVVRAWSSDLAFRRQEFARFVRNLISQPSDIPNPV